MLKLLPADEVLCAVCRLLDLSTSQLDALADSLDLPKGIVRYEPGSKCVTKKGACPCCAVLHAAHIMHYTYTESRRGR